MDEGVVREAHRNTSLPPSSSIKTRLGITQRGIDIYLTYGADRLFWLKEIALFGFKHSKTYCWEYSNVAEEHSVVLRALSR